MEERKTPPKIWEGKKKAFLVCDKSFKDMNAPFLEFLKKEGYTYGSHKGSYGCPWVHVDITTKQYAYGMPGIEPVGAIGDHAITIGEFMTIYNIYKKYENKSIFVFDKERFDYDSAALWPFKARNNLPTYEKIEDVIKEIDPNVEQIRLTLGVIDCDAPYLSYHTVNLYMPACCDAQHKVYDFLSRIDMLQTITILEQINKIS